MSDMITASISSHPPRLSLLPKAVASLIDQVDQLNVYLNNIDTVPEFLKSPKINVVLSKDAAGDIFSRAKFYWSETVQGYHVLVDDDIVYPSDYVERMITRLDQYKRKVVMCVHANMIPNNFTTFYASHVSIPFWYGLKKDMRVHIPGAGTVVYHSDLLSIPHDIFTDHFCEDILIGKYFLSKDVPVISISRPVNWLRSVGYQGEAETVFARFKDSDQVQTRLVKEVAWPLYELDRDVLVSPPTWQQLLRLGQIHGTRLIDLVRK